MNLPPKILAEFLVYKGNAAPFFGRDFSSSHSTVSHHPTRKEFFAKLAGTAAAVAATSKIFAQTSPTAQAPAANAVPVKLRPETRAVARRADSV
jgi:hypothetical protein